MSSTPVNLLDLKPEEFKKFLDSFDYVFSDCDGVIWQANALPRVGEFFDMMKEHGKIVHYASNNSLRSRENYEAKFADANIENGFESLTIPSIAIAEYLKAANMTKKVYCVACDEAVKMLRSYGFECVTGPAVGPESFADYIKFLEDDPEIGAVIFDSDINGNLAKLHKAATYLKRPDVLFLNGASDKTVHFKKGYSTLGVSFFTEAVAEHVNRQPVELAKPSKEFGQLVMKRVGATDPSRVLFIGDMIDQDIGLGKNTGFQTLMVLTHIPKEAMLAHKTIRPDYYAESLGSIVPLL